MIISTIKKVATITALVIAVSLPSIVVAQNNTTNTTNTTNTIGPGREAFGFGAKLDKVADSYSPSSSVPLEERIGSIIAFFLSLLGVVFMILIIFAGFRWMTAAGDEEQIKKSTETIKAAVIGLVIVMAAYALSVFLIQRLWGTV